MTESALQNAEQDEAAVAAVRNGDAERYRELVERHERRVFAVAWSRLGDATLAEEATQEAFIRAYRRLWLLGDGAKFAGWVNTITRHIAINLGIRHRRELNKRERWALETVEGPEDTTVETDPLYTPETLRQTLAGLPDAHRECLVLFYLEGKSGTEAAAALGISEAALRVRLHRARAAMRERLEEKLEGSLAKLRPEKSVVPAVMIGVLAASSAKAATAGETVAVGTGVKILSMLGKSFLFSWFMPLLMMIGTLPSLLFVEIIGRMDRKNFRDAHGFRPQLHKRFMRSFMWGYPLLFVSMMLITWALGTHKYGMTCFMLALLLISARSLTINRNAFQVGTFAYTAIIAAGIFALAMGWIPPSLGMLPLATASVLYCFIFNKRPTRMDYNLFLRAAHGLLKLSDEAEDFPQANRFDRRALLAFARFLGSRYLVYNFRWETNGLALRLPPIRNQFLVNMAALFMPPFSGNCSYISLGWDGTVLAHCGEKDGAELTALNTSKMRDPGELESVVVEIVRQAWEEFRGGNLAAAERTLGESLDSEVFLVSPARAKSTRWWRFYLIASVVAMFVLMPISWWRSKHASQNSLNLKPVELTESEARHSLERKARFKNFAEAIKFGDNVAPYNNIVLPPTNLMSAEALEKMRALVLNDFDQGEKKSSERVDLLLGAPFLQKAVVNDWLTKEQLGITEATLRQTITNASKFEKQHWFEVQPMGVAAPKDPNNASGKPKLLGYTVLDVDRLALTVRCLEKLGCLDVIQDKFAAETLLQHQILTDHTPPGRRPVSDTKRLRGLFYTMGYDPILDTYYSLVVLEKLGRLGRVNREACIEGILRFHCGEGLFASPNKEDGLVIFGNQLDTIAAFESLRILGGLDRVKDLDKWKFRPFFTRTTDDAKERVATWDEIESWVCERRLEKILRQRRENPKAPIRSLLQGEN